jgi:hypothetical protein
MELVLDKIYNDPKSPAGVAGVNQLLIEAKKIEPNIKRKNVVEYLQNHSTYTQFRPRRVRFPRSKTVPAGYLTDVQCDLADMGNHSMENEGNNYILVAIDVLSKQIFAAPIKTKTPIDLIPAFERIFGQMEMICHRLFSDKGGEFTGKVMRKYFENKEVDKIECNSSSVKAALAENAIKRLKQRIYRYFHRVGTYKWIDVLDKIVYAINHSKSRVLGGLCPADISFKNAQALWRKNYGPIEKLINPKVIKAPRYKVGDYVRMSRNKSTFAKGYTPSFDNEIIQVDKVKPAVRPNGTVQYWVKDAKGEPFDGFFYEQDLTKVRLDERIPYRIEKEIQRKKNKDGKMEYLVKFFSDPVPQWIHENQLL